MNLNVYGLTSQTNHDTRSIIISHITYGKCGPTHT